MKNKRLYSFLLSLILVLSTFLSTSGHALAAEGAGTEASPYLIKTVSDLFAIPAETEAHYKLMNNLDVEGLKKEPLGEFKGVFDGAGYTIKNLNTVSDQHNNGLFSKVTGATIKNLTIDGANISFASYNYVGAIAGIATNSTFSHCIVKNSEITAGSYAGGLCGQATGSVFESCVVQGVNLKGKGAIGALVGTLTNVSTMTGSKSIGNTISSTGSTAGGLIGQLTKSEVTLCYSELGEINSTGINTGGLIGYVYNNSTVKQSYATTDVNSTSSYVGGLIGYTNLTNNLSECYANNQVKGTTITGGLVGGLNASAVTNIDNCYSLSKVTATASANVIGGLVGSNITTMTNSFSACELEGITKYALAASGTMTNCYFDEEILKITAPSHQARATAQMKKALNYTGWDFDTIWTIDEGNNYPTLRFATEISKPGEGNGEDEEPNPENPTNGTLKIVLKTNEQLQLSLNNDFSINADATWKSSDSTIATVDNNGVVKAIKAGSAVITVNYAEEDYTETIKVLVSENIEFLRLAVDFKVGEKALATIDELTNTTSVKWSVMDTTVATVSKRGNIIAKGKGLTIVTALANDGTVFGQIYVRVR